MKFKYIDAHGRNIQQVASYIFTSNQVNRLAPDNLAIGHLLRRTRTARAMSLRTLAIRMKVSAPYLSDLELGRRSWTEARVLQFMKALHA